MGGKFLKLDFFFFPLLSSPLFSLFIPRVNLKASMFQSLRSFPLCCRYEITSTAPKLFLPCRLGNNLCNI